MQVKCHRAITKYAVVLLSTAYMLAIYGSNVCAESYGKIKYQAKVADSDSDATIGHPVNMFFGDIVLGYEHSSWKINEDNRNPVLDYKTEGLALYRIIGNIGYGNIPFATIIYEKPMKSNDRQDEIIEAKTSQESRLEKFTGGVKLDPLVDYILPDDT